MSIPLHPDDQQDVDDLRRNLIGWRIFLGFHQKVLARKAGVPESAVGRIERGEPGYLKLASIARVAAVFRNVINIRFEDLDLKETTPELESLYSLVEAKPYEGVWLESLIQAYLKAVRMELDIPAAMLAPKLNMRVDQFEKWEEDASDLDVTVLMAYARELGGRMRIDLARAK